jgi:hypothetical protein
MHTAVLGKQIAYERYIQYQTFATFPVMVAVEDCLER